MTGEGSRTVFLLPALAFLAILFSPCLADVLAQVPRSGDLAACLTPGDPNTCLLAGIPGQGTEALVPPSDEDMATWRAAVDALLAGDEPTAAFLADSLGYDLVELSDTGQRDGVFLVLLERPGGTFRGLGTYVYNRGASRPLSFEAPHALTDGKSLESAIAFFSELDALGLLITGTTRCSNSQPSYCAGCSSVCPATTPYVPISDAAHYTRSFYQLAHEEIEMMSPGLVSASIHASCPDPRADVSISNGTSENRPGSLATRLMDAYNVVLQPLGLRAQSCNDENDADDLLCAEENVQGRYSNGSPDACLQVPNPCAPVHGSVAGAERFLHVEQTCAVLETPWGCSAPCAHPNAVSFGASARIWSEVFPARPRGHLTRKESAGTSQAGATFGAALAAGDFDGDGKDDLAIGAPNEDDAVPDVGGASVFFGAVDAQAPRGPQHLGATLADLLPHEADRFGAALTAGDFDGDGKDDLAVGIPYRDEGATDSGGVLVFHGSASGLLPPFGQALDSTGAGLPAQVGDHFGAASIAADFDGDGYEDLAVAAPDADADALDDGAVAIFYGSPVGLSLARAQTLRAASAGMPSQAGDHFGAALTAADFDGDGRSDLAVAMPERDDPSVDDGAVIVFYGSPAGLLPARADCLTQASGGAPSQAGDRFGTALTAGDFDGDGKGDLAIGIPFRDEPIQDAGSVMVFQGSPAGLLPASVERIERESAGEVSDTAQLFGRSLAAADFGGDGRDDLAVGVPGALDVAPHAGLTLVFHGSPGGLLPALPQHLGQRAAGGIPEEGDAFASSLAVGDFDGDGRKDLVIGSPAESIGGAEDAGAVYVPLPAVVGEVPRLVWETKARLAWKPARGATAYNVYRGDGSSLPRLLTSTPDSCLSLTTPGLTGNAPSAPQSRALYWYLVRPTNAVAEGPAGDASAGHRIQDGAQSCDLVEEKSELRRGP